MCQRCHAGANHRSCLLPRPGLGFRVCTYSLHCSSLFGLTNSILRILKGNPKKELQWRLWVVLFRYPYIHYIQKPSATKDSKTILSVVHAALRRGQVPSSSGKYPSRQLLHAIPGGASSRFAVQLWKGSPLGLFRRRLGFGPTVNVPTPPHDTQRM